MSPALTTGLAADTAASNAATLAALAAQSVIQAAGDLFTISPACKRTAARVLTDLWLSAAPTNGRRPSDRALTPQVFPLPLGGVQLEWHAGDDHIEVSIEWAGAVGLYAKSSAGERDWEIAPPDSIPYFASSTLSRISDAVWAADLTI